MPAISRESILVFKELGSGGNGVVEEVWPGAEAGESVAMKRLKEEDRRHQEIVGRFKREVRILQRLSHPNIISVLDADLESDDPWFLMPLASSHLGEEVTRSPLPTDRIRDVFTAVLDALEYAHHHGVLHRDLKPENILAMPDGRLTVSDFGLGLRTNSETLKLTRTGTGRGTEGYAAPEQWVDFARVDERADIFGLGALLYEMSTGLNPLVGNPRAAPVAYQRIIQRCRQHDPANRYQTVAELREAFLDLFTEVEDSLSAASRAAVLLETAPASARDRHVVIDLYRRYPDDPELFPKTLPLWSKELIEAQIADGIDDVPMMINNLCDQLPGKHAFSFLDQVATFLSVIFQATEDVEIRELVLTRLLQVGGAGNRYAVARAFAELAAQARASHEVTLVRDVLRDHPRDALFAEPFIRAKVRNSSLLQTLEEIQAAQNLVSEPPAPIPPIPGRSRKTWDWDAYAMEDRNERSDPVRDHAMLVEDLRAAQRQLDADREKREGEYLTFLGEVAVPALSQLASELRVGERDARVRRVTSANVRANESAERLEIEVRERTQPIFTCTIYGAIVPERAFVRKIFTEVVRGSDPSQSRPEVRLSDHPLVPDEPKPNDAKGISAEDVIRTVSNAYRAFLGDLGRL